MCTVLISVVVVVVVVVIIFLTVLIGDLKGERRGENSRELSNWPLKGVSKLDPCKKGFDSDNFRHNDFNFLRGIHNGEA